MTNIGIINPNPDSVLTQAPLTRTSSNGEQDETTLQDMVLSSSTAKSTNTPQEIWQSFGPFYKYMSTVSGFEEEVKAEVTGVDSSAFIYYDRLDTIALSLIDDNGQATKIGSGCQLIGSDLMQGDLIDVTTSISTNEGRNSDRWGAFRIPNGFGLEDMKMFQLKLLEKRNFYKLLPATLQEEDTTNGNTFTRKTQLTSYKKFRKGKSSRSKGTAMIILAPQDNGQMLYGVGGIVKASIIITEMAKNVSLDTAMKYNGQPIQTVNALATQLNMSEKVITLLQAYFPHMSNSVLARFRSKKYNSKTRTGTRGGQGNFKVKITVGANNSVDIQYVYTVWQAGVINAQIIPGVSRGTVQGEGLQTRGSVFNIIQNYSMSFLPGDLLDAIIENAQSGQRKEVNGKIRKNFDSFDQLVTNMTGQARWISPDFLKPDFQWTTFTWSFTKKIGSFPFGNIGYINLLKNEREIVNASVNVFTGKLKKTAKTKAGRKYAKSTTVSPGINGPITNIDPENDIMQDATIINEDTFAAFDNGDVEMPSNNIPENVPVQPNTGLVFDPTSVNNGPSQSFNPDSGGTLFSLDSFSPEIFQEPQGINKF